MCVRGEIEFGISRGILKRGVDVNSVHLLTDGVEVGAGTRDVNGR